jgi:uncharacterized membrane protein
MAYFSTYLAQDAAAAVPVIRRIEVKAIREVLEEGVSDFWAMPSHAAFLALVYPLCGMVLAYAPERSAVGLSVSLRFCASRSLRGRRPIRNEPAA